MPTLENLTEADLRSLLKAKSLRRARSYVTQVYNPTRCGRTLTAQVRGTHLYDVEINVMSGAINARCSCPYDWGGYCKHIGAVLLRWIRSPGSFVVKRAPALPRERPIEVIPVELPPTHRPQELPSWLKVSFSDRQRADNQQLHQWLEETSMQGLRQIAEQRGWKATGTRKAEVVQQVFEHITDPDENLGTILSLDEEHRQVLCALVLLGDTAGPDDVGRVASVWGGLKSQEQMATYMRHLREVGLTVSGQEDDYAPQSDIVPLTIVRNLPPVLRQGEEELQLAPHHAGRQGAVAPRPVGNASPRLCDPCALVRTAHQIILLLERSPSPLRPPMPRPRLEKLYPTLGEWNYDAHELVRAKESGNLQPQADWVLTVPPPRYLLPDDTIERLAPVAEGEARLEFIFSLLMTAGVFQPGSPVTVWPEVRSEFLHRDELTQRAILARVYFQMPNWSALWEMLRRDDKLQLKRALNDWFLKPVHLHTHLVHFRQLVLRTLASLPNGEWIALEDLSHVMRAVWPQFDQAVWQSRWRPDRRGSWFLSEAGSREPLQPADVRQWRLAQGDFIRTAITGPLHWLGLADLGFGDDGGLAATRFHGLTDLYWDRVEAPTAPLYGSSSPYGAPDGQAMALEKAVRIEHTTISVEPAAISTEAHGLLDHIARLETATADRFVYQLDPQAAYEAFESGAALSEILEDWERLMPAPVPKVIRKQLSDWWEAYGRVRIYEHLTVIEFSDDYGLAEMKAITSLKQYLVAEVSSRLVIIPQQAVAPLTAELEGAGFTPKQTDEA